MFVYVVGPDQKAAVRPVQVEHTESDTAIIAKGLEPGEQVVTDGQFQLRPGARVAPKPAGSGAPNAGRPPGGGPPGANASGAPGPAGAPSGSAAMSGAPSPPPAGTASGAPR
jgi:multidrug efflux system membrane fusion protein